MSKLGRTDAHKMCLCDVGVFFHRQRTLWPDCSTESSAQVPHSRDEDLCHRGGFSPPPPPHTHPHHASRIFPAKNAQFSFLLLTSMKFRLSPPPTGGPLDQGSAPVATNMTCMSRSNLDIMYLRVNDLLPRVSCLLFHQVL